MDNSPMNNGNSSGKPTEHVGGYGTPNPIVTHQPMPHTQIAFGLQLPQPPSPIPSADELDKYKRLLGDEYLERVFAITEANAKTERDTKERAQTLQWRESVISRVCGLIFAVSALGTILLLSYWKFAVVAAAVAAAIAATTFAIVTRAKTQDKKE